MNDPTSANKVSPATRPPSASRPTNTGMTSTRSPKAWLARIKQRIRPAGRAGAARVAARMVFPTFRDTGFAPEFTNADWERFRDEIYRDRIPSA
ncbi:hypothetical protein RM530_11820 [Algiphilus sp. W345]|uniref:Uncharacterized protein n=1 Tax=Banduia mediterranea TaxID=3075609 RepID=A0ABU2WL71_9GAMM|nr:hypothetical protein [Algiphilus sp. W345]MDT0498046.1 hypothetical protein [Algiphilus sp. W345]